MFNNSRELANAARNHDLGISKITDKSQSEEIDAALSTFYALDLDEKSLEQFMSLEETRQQQLTLFKIDNRNILYDILKHAKSMIEDAIAFISESQINPDFLQRLLNTTPTSLAGIRFLTQNFATVAKKTTFVNLLLSLDRQYQNTIIEYLMVQHEDENTGWYKQSFQNHFDEAIEKMPNEQIALLNIITGNIVGFQKTAALVKRLSDAHKQLQNSVPKDGNIEEIKSLIKNLSSEKLLRDEISRNLDAYKAYNPNNTAKINLIQNAQDNLADLNWPLDSIVDFFTNEDNKNTAGAQSTHYVSSILGTVSSANKSLYTIWQESISKMQQYHQKLQEAKSKLADEKIIRQIFTQDEIYTMVSQSSETIQMIFDTSPHKTLICSLIIDRQLGENFTGFNITVAGQSKLYTREELYLLFHPEFPQDLDHLKEIQLLNNKRETLGFQPLISVDEVISNAHKNYSSASNATDLNFSYNNINSNSNNNNNNNSSNTSSSANTTSKNKAWIKN